MAHTVQIKELLNGIKITETIDAQTVVRFLSLEGRPFLRSTNEDDAETYQIIDKVGEIYNLPALATEFVLIDLNESVYVPGDGAELIEYSFKIRSFRADPERDTFKVGTIETTANSVKINISEDGTNWARINGVFYEKYYPDTFNFTPVTTGQKILIIYAKPDAQTFYLAQGAESTEAVEPDYDGLFIARIIAGSAGEIVEENDNGYKVRSEDAWRTINNAAPMNIVLGNQPEGSFHLTGTEDITGFTTKMGKFMWPGRGMILYTEQAVTLKHQPQEPTTNAKYFTFAEDFTTKPDGWYILKEKASFIEVVELGGGSAEFPAGNPGDVLVKTADDVEFSDRLTVAENEIDAEVVNRAMADALKLDKPTTPNNVPARVINGDGSTSDKGDFQLSEQIEISTNQTAQNAWKGKEIWVTASCTLTIPAPSDLSAAWNIDILVFPSITLTLAITSGGTWLHTTPTPVTDAFFRIARRGSTTTFKTLGL